ncbi:MAG TPA: hypothetical protein VL463_29885 [Kofleriaceae bacterium]|nr:hypothetical protein [Kofleriaceae bacterium]
MIRPLTGLLVILLVAATAHAQPPSDEDHAKQLLQTLAQSSDASAREAAAKELSAIGAHVTDVLAQHLARTRTSSIEDRRKALTAIHASVPDKNGVFKQPSRDDKPVDDSKVDWIADLAKLDPATPGLGDVISDVAALRALGASKDIKAARVILDAAFGADTMIYRDECGRQLRGMAPYSIPALTIDSQAKSYDRKRYATYQLERLDRQDPTKALASAAGDEALRVAILDAFRTTHHREAVHAVLATVDDDSPRVREAARATWMAYVTGPPPPPAPKKKLVLPGGQLAKKETPLWMTYRELADFDLRKLSADLLGKAYDEKDEIDLEAVSKEIFAHYDAERQKRDDAVYQAAKERAKGGDLANATAVFDQLLAANPDRPWRAEMATCYFEYGKQLVSASKWRDAAAAYEKANVLDPSGANAKEAQAGHDFALGKALEAEGKDGGAALRRAASLQPDYASDKRVAEALGEGDKSPWLLYAAIAAGVLALVFFAVGMRRRTA